MIHPRRTLLGALLWFFAAAAFGGPLVGLLESDGDFTPAGAESTRALSRLEAASGEKAGAGVILVATLRSPARSRAGEAEIRQLTNTVIGIPGVARVASATTTDDASLLARDGRSASLVATIRASADEDDVANAIVDRFGNRPGLLLGGPSIADLQLGEQIASDLGRSEALAFPLLALLSLLFFRGARAALIPLAAGGLTVLSTFAALRAINELTPLSIFAINLVIGLGLGLAIDYSLLLLTRFREELIRLGPGPAAVAATMRTAGRTVLFSAGTVAVALATLTLFPLKFLQSMGIGGAVVALVAAGVALVLTPAFLALWGTRLTPRGGHASQRAAAGRWARIAAGVMRRPGTIAAVTMLVMLGLSAPALRATWSPVDITVLPTSLSARATADALARDFPRDDSAPITVALSGPATRSPGLVREFVGQVERLPTVESVGAPRTLGRDVVELRVTATGRAAGPGARAAARGIRELPTQLRVEVAGTAAAFLDQQAAISSRLGIAIAALAMFTFALLWLMTGSVVLPLKALLMNALSVGVVLGVLTLIFQDGRLEGLLGYTSNGGVEPTNFLITAALVFALSTDYGVFLLGRVKEARDAGASERACVVEGVSRTGAVVTASAILLAVAIGAFAMSSVVFIKQIGIGAAIGVLVDALVVRALLVPSLMALLGHWNWWSPPWLRQLHGRIGPREHSSAASSPAQ